ncbi:MAG TPA: PAS domain S-box protein [bacterium]|nr:PAS domain S-box protein [bacterium]
MSRHKELRDRGTVRNVGRRDDAPADHSQFLRLLFDNGPLPMWVYDPDTLRFLAVNQAAVDQYGYAREEFLAMRVSDIRTPDAVPQLLADIAARRPGLRRTAERRHMCKDGRVITVGVTSQVVEFAGRTAVLVVAHDITEEVNAAALRSRLAAIVESSDDAIISATLDGVITSWNAGAEWMYGYTAADMLGRSVAVLAAPDRRDEITSILERLARGDRIDHLETVRIRRDGTRFDVSLAISPVRDRTGRIVGVSTIARDITARKQTEREVHALNRALEERVRERTKELDAANQELEAFTYTVAHDLRSPLITIDGFSRILLEDHGPALDEDARHCLDQVVKGTRHMNALITDLLAFSRLSRQALCTQTVPPADVARRVMAELMQSAGERCVEFRVGDLPTCQADPMLLEQVFVNLLSNALKFTRACDRAVIEVGCGGSDDAAYATYFVKDNGTGFDMRYVDKLFHVFQRLHRAEEYEGTGVGLAIVQRIVCRHGGTAWAEGTPGLGAIIFFTLPKADGA